MCGIAGWIDYNNIAKDKNVLNSMLSTLKKRGPDATGIYEDNEASLLHARLIVIDPDSGLQPMTVKAKGETYTIIYNGELYNTEELRLELISKGYCFKGHSDTEVLLYAFIEWEEECCSKLNGIFAFAVWQKNSRSVFIARDRIGVKPLFYFKYNGGLIFGSEIKTLLKNPLVKPIIDNDGLNQIFLLGPARVFGSGIIKNVDELEPSEYLYLNENCFYKKRYWSLLAKPHEENFNDTVEKTKFMVTDAIQRQLVSDVPLACFLSGGLDSSIISYVAAEEFKKRSSQLTTYSISYKDNDKYFKTNSFQPSADDSYIVLMSQFIKSAHKDMQLDSIDIAKALDEAALARDLPGMADIDSSLLLFCKAIKPFHTVCLSGECADEIFGGYPWYHREDILFKETFPWSDSIELRKKLFNTHLLANEGEDYVDYQYKRTIELTSYLDEDDKKSRRMREMFVLNFYWFMQTLLDRKDRMSMYTGLEARVPFCDYRLIEYAYNMPWKFKSYKGREKGILRQAFKGILPDEIIERKKSPFPKTFNPVFMDYVKQRLSEAMKDKHSILNTIVNKTYLDSLCKTSVELKEPWYGQLMRLPQIFAYLLQIDTVFKEYSLQLE